jgi:inhibitor of cysteine peptidase
VKGQTSGLIAPIAALTLLAACAHLRPPRPLALTTADSGKSIEMVVGQTCTITLPWDPATGYRWQIVADPDARTLIVLDSGFERLPSNSRSSSSRAAGSQKPGTDGHAWWKLRATGAGSTSFAVRYVRPWEPDAQAREFTITVEVKRADKSG